MRRISLLLIAIPFTASIYSQVEFEAHVLDTSVTEVTAVCAVDLDSDSNIDILAAYEDNIVWFKNSGTGTFTKHIVTSNSIIVSCIASSDMDGDGDMDLLSFYDDNIVWFENDLNEEFILHPIATSENDVSDLFPIDINFDGSSDVVIATGGRENFIAFGKIDIYFNDGNKSFSVKTVDSIDVTSIFANDLDSDGDIDLITSTDYNNRIAWYENDGNENYLPHTISYIGAPSIHCVDLNKDGHLDILGVYHGRIYWYRNEGDMNFEEIIIPIIGYSNCRVHTDDMNGDGYIDILDAGDKIVWYENDGNENFNPHIIAGSIAERYFTPIFTIDIDDDGDVDMISTSGYESRLTLYENKLFNAGTNVDIASTEKLNIYPNPTHSFLTIEIENSTHYNIEFTSLSGQLILSKDMEGTTHQLDLSSFQKGVYFITIRSKDFVTTRKIIKL
jgi:hypothetical protein